MPRLHQKQIFAPQKTENCFLNLGRLFFNYVLSFYGKSTIADREPNSVNFCVNVSYDNVTVYLIAIAR